VSQSSLKQVEVDIGQWEVSICGQGEVTAGHCQQEGTGRTRTDYGGCCVCKESHCPRAVFNPIDIAVMSKVVGHLQRTIWF